MNAVGFVLVGEIERSVDQVLVRSDQKYFRVGIPVWETIARLQAGETRSAVEANLQRHFPVHAPEGMHPILAAADDLRAKASAMGRARGIPRARIEFDISTIATLAAKTVGRVLTVSWLLGVLLAANLAAQHYMPRPAFSDLFGVEITPSMAMEVTAAMFLIMALHELSHAAVAVHYGCRSYKIGLGIFFILPVFYADVSEIWRLNPRKRIMVNLAGVTAQLWIGLLLALSAFVAPTAALPFLVVLSGINLSSVVFNLLPFARFDGYWVLVDLSGVAALQRTGIEVLRSWLGRRSYRNLLTQRQRTFAGLYAGAALVFYAWILYAVGTSVVNIVMIGMRAPDASSRLEMLTRHPFTWLFVAYLMIAAYKRGTRAFGSRPVALQPA